MVVASSGYRIQPRLILDFSSEDGAAAIHQWYKRQGSNTRFTSLEYRQDRKGRFRHEFVVVRLDQTTLCRFDRRAQGNLPRRAPKGKGTATEDSAHLLRTFESGYQEMVEKSKVLLSISFPDGEDLKLILAICFGIQSHPRATSSNLLRYNCYFFSWTIVTAVARRAVKWEDVLTPEIVQEAIQLAANNDRCGYVYTRLHPRTVPSQSLCARIRSWFANPVKATHHTPTTSDDQAIMDLWGIYGFRSAHQTEVWGFDHLLRKQLLRSQLAPALAGEIQRFAQTTLLRAMCSVAECDIQELIFSELKYQTPESYSYLFPGVATLAENICRTVAEIMIEINNENSGKNKHSGANFLVLDDAWDHAGRSHYWELSYLNSYACSSGYAGGHGGAAVDQFGKAVKEIGKRTMRGTRGKYAKLVFEHSTVLAKKVAAALLESLDDLDPERLTFVGSAKRTWLPCSKRRMKQAMTASKHSPVQTYIRCRMQDHFGFGTSERLLTTAEESMCEIWVATMNVLDRDISSWTMNPLEKRALGWDLDSDSDSEYLDKDSYKDSKYQLL